MFLCRYAILNRTAQKSYLAKRFSSSSCSNDAKNTELSNKQNEKTTSKKSAEKLPFMPVINIPEKELAHNAFFSLHRPLLGLSSENKRSFFSQKSLEEEQEAEMDEALFQYMSTLEHFVEPLTPGSQESAQETIISTYTPDYLEKDDIELLEPEIQTQEILPSSLPVYRMPESTDVVDFLTTIESKMSRENSILKQLERVRLKKQEILDNSRRYPSPRFYTSGLRRFQQKGKQ